MFEYLNSVHYNDIACGGSNWCDVSDMDLDSRDGICDYVWVSICCVFLVFEIEIEIGYRSLFAKEQRVSIIFLSRRMKKFKITDSELLQGVIVLVLIEAGLILAQNVGE